MYIELDPSLLEESVFLALRRREQSGDLALYRAYRERVDALYESPDDDPGREIAFRDVHAEFFRALGFERTIRLCLDEFPLLSRQLDRVAFLKAVSRKEEGGELFVREDNGDGQGRRRTAVLRLQAELFLDSDRLPALLRRELVHISDMVDPAFGYRPDLGDTGESIAQENLVRDRYRAVWSVFVEARLVRAGHAPAAALQKRQSQVKKAFEGLANRDVEVIYQRASCEESLTHEDLLALARNQGRYEQPITSSLERTMT